MRFNKVATNKALNASLAQKIWDFANISVLFDTAQLELFFLKTQLGQSPGQVRPFD